MAANKAKRGTGGRAGPPERNTQASYEAALQGNNQPNKLIPEANPVSRAKLQTTHGLGEHSKKHYE